MSVIFFPNTLILTNLFPKATMPGPPWSTKFTKTLSLGPLQSTGSKMITINAFYRSKLHVHSLKYQISIIFHLLMNSGLTIKY